MKCLVTGGAGFIGSHLSEALLKEGHSVAVIDNLSTGKASNISHLMENASFAFYKDTIMNAKLMERLISRCDIVFHLAAAVGVKYIIEHQLDAILTNINGTEVILSLAAKHGRKPVLLASTSEVYGKDRPGKSIFAENDDRVLGTTTITRWSYSCTKALDEFLALAYFKEKRLPVYIVRFFNTCGPRQTGRYGMVVPRFVRQALTGAPITIFGDGKQTRCFTDVADAVRAILCIVKTPGTRGQIFNIGNPANKISIAALAKKVKAMTGSSSSIRRISYEKAYTKGFEDMRHREPNITKLKKHTHFSPSIGIDAMLRRIIDDCH